eukprot:5825223-Pyramimonas_sp.AAC.1
MQQAVGHLMRGVVAPAWHHWLLPQRLANYLEQHPQFELFSEFQRMAQVTVAEVDSDWASEPGRRSVDGGPVHGFAHDRRLEWPTGQSRAEQRGGG